MCGNVFCKLVCPRAHYESNPEKNMLACITALHAPIFVPLGFGDGPVLGFSMSAVMYLGLAHSFVMKILWSILSVPLELFLWTIAFRPSLMVSKIVCFGHSGKLNTWVWHQTCVVSCWAHEVSSAAEVVEQQSAHMLSW